MFHLKLNSAPHIHAHTNTDIKNTQTNKKTHAHTHKHTKSHIRTHTNTHTHTQTHTHTNLGVTVTLGSLESLSRATLVKMVGVILLAGDSIRVLAKFCPSAITLPTSHSFLSLLKWLLDEEVFKTGVIYACSSATLCGIKLALDALTLKSTCWKFRIFFRFFISTSRWMVHQSSRITMLVRRWLHTVHKGLKRSG